MPRGDDGHPSASVLACAELSTITAYCNGERLPIVGCQPLQQGDSQAACFPITETHGLYAWLLARPQRAEDLVKPKNQPQPMFFNPF